MQIQIIATPPGEMLTCLSFAISEGEVATIGNTAASKIALPSAASQEKEQYGRIVEDSGQWSLESYCAELFTLNHAKEPLPRGGKKDLQDGDLISCKGYQLMFSNFSPWKSEPFTGTEPQSMEPLGSLETLVSDHLIASQTTDVLDDPFLIEESRESEPPQESAEVHLLLADAPPSKSAPGVVQGVATPGLIDVLADQGFQDEPFEQSETFWSAGLQLKQTHRMMEHFPVESDLLSSRKMQEPLPVTSLNEPLNKAMLSALTETLNDLEPDQLLKAMNVSRSWWPGMRSESAFWKQYVSVFKQRAFSEEYQQLFIQRVHHALRSNALKKAKKNDVTSGEKVER